ncbi:MAG: pyridoxamine 5'-phosphate oxidase family protein [Clostridiaceae bacterium]
MKEVLDFLTECGTFFISTVDGDQPRVRPFGFVMDYEGKLCLCTSNKKPTFAQLKVNPKTEISATKDGRWIRLSGEAEFCTTKESKAKALEVAPSLKAMYSVDDDIFEVFYIKNVKAVIADFSGNVEEYVF